MSEPKLLTQKALLAALNTMQQYANFENTGPARATVTEHIAALEARIAELEPLAELGRLVEQMPEDWGLVRHCGKFTTASRESILYCPMDDYDSPADALRALVGEKDGT